MLSPQNVKLCDAHTKYNCLDARAFTFCARDSSFVTLHEKKKKVQRNVLLDLSEYSCRVTKKKKECQRDDNFESHTKFVCIMTMDRRPNVRPHRIECQRTNERPEKKMKKKIEKKQKTTTIAST